MKMTVITDASGMVIGTINGHLKDMKQGDLNYRPIPTANQKIHEIEVGDDCLKMAVKELHEHVHAQLKKVR